MGGERSVAKFRPDHFLEYLMTFAARKLWPGVQRARRVFAIKRIDCHGLLPQRALLLWQASTDDSLGDMQKQRPICAGWRIAQQRHAPFAGIIGGGAGMCLHCRNPFPTPGRDGPPRLFNLCSDPLSPRRPLPPRLLRLRLLLRPPPHLLHRPRHPHPRPRPHLLPILRHLLLVLLRRRRRPPRLL